MRAAVATMELEITGITETVLVIVVVEPVPGLVVSDVGTVEKSSELGGYAHEQMEEIWETIFVAHG